MPIIGTICIHLVELVLTFMLCQDTWSNYVMNAVIVQPLSLIVINNGCYLFTFDKNCENYNLGTSTCDNKNTKYS